MVKDPPEQERLNRVRFDPAEFASGRCTPVLDGAVVVLHDGDASIVAFENRCPHAGQPLDGASVIDGVLRCPHHFWGYAIPSGRNMTGGPGLIAVPVAIVGNEVEVTFSDPTPVPSLRELLLEHAKTWTRGDDPEASSLPRTLP